MSEKAQERLAVLIVSFIYLTILYCLDLPEYVYYMLTALAIVSVGYFLRRGENIIKEKVEKVKEDMMYSKVVTVDLNKFTRKAYEIENKGKDI